MSVPVIAFFNNKSGVGKTSLVYRTAWMLADLGYRVLAGRYAQRALPAIFRADDPLLEVTLPRETRLELESLLEELPRETFLADDSLGWLYQFWQSAEKERVNKEGDKITGDTLSAVTQLFTEHYMVLFLLHNTIGAWYAGKVLAERPDLASSAKDETELRAAMRLTEAGGYDFDYLRFVRTPSSTESEEDENSGPWRPMGGTFDGWPKTTAELKLLDPCCGSEHFLVVAFELLVRLRMHEEGLSLSDSVDTVLQDNLFGLELDARCTQIAAFNIAISAWKLSDPRELPAMDNIAWTGLSVGVPRDTWMQAIESEGSSNLRFYFGQFYDMFSNASTLGSLINPTRFLGSHSLRKDDFERLFSSLETVIAKDPATAPEQHELGVATQGLARAAEILAGQYHLVLTNVPYLGRGKQDDILKDHIQTYYDLGKADLATAFVLRCLEFCSEGGGAGLVTPNNWLYLTTFTKLRDLLLTQREWQFAARLGPGAFETISGHVVNVALLSICAAVPANDHEMAGTDVSDDGKPNEKARGLTGQTNCEISLIRQESQLDNPDSRNVVERSAAGSTQLADVATVAQGLSTTDGPQFLVQFWELSSVSQGWEFLQTASRGSYVDGCSLALCWSACGERYFKHIDRLRDENRIGGAWQAGRLAWGKTGVSINVTSTKHVSWYSGAKYDVTIGAAIPKTARLAPAVYCYLTSGEYLDALRALDPSLSVTEGSLLKVAFDEDRWRREAEKQFPRGLPDSESDDPTQWLFHGYPRESLFPHQASVARLLGYRWPAELAAKMRLSDRTQELVKRCGEIASHADHDGIVCIPSVRSEDTATVRLPRLLEACGVQLPNNINSWLRNDFFKEHCDLFSGRHHQFPFIWHIWDGRKNDGFHALINYHKLVSPGGHKLLENLTYSYLGDWISRQEHDVKRGESGADGRLAAAKTLQERLVAILAGEPPYHIFVRWKPIHEQPIGWHPDINDGVRINIRSFMAVDIPGGMKGAGILRVKPKIKWSKDRGKEPKRPKEEYPWFWGRDDSTEDFAGGDTFIGERWNDCHYTNAFKHAAREARKGKP